MKKFLCLNLLVMMFLFTGCGLKTENNENTRTPANNNAETVTEESRMMPEKSDYFPDDAEISYENDTDSGENEAETDEKWFLGDLHVGINTEPDEKTEAFLGYESYIGYYNFTAEKKSYYTLFLAKDDVDYGHYSPENVCIKRPKNENSLENECDETKFTRIVNENKRFGLLTYLEVGETIEVHLAYVPKDYILIEYKGDSAEIKEDREKLYSFPDSFLQTVSVSFGEESYIMEVKSWDGYNPEKQ